jgi:hypothetical protein
MSKVKLRNLHDNFMLVRRVGSQASPTVKVRLFAQLCMLEIIPDVASAAIRVVPILPSPIVDFADMSHEDQLLA